MKQEYDFSRAARGKYAGRFPSEPVFVKFDPDVSALLDGPGTLTARLRALAEARRRKSRSVRTVRSIMLARDEYRALKTVLDRLGGRATGPRESKAGRAG